MSEADIVVRAATADDVPGIFRARTAVTENALTLDVRAAARLGARRHHVKW